MSAELPHDAAEGGGAQCLGVFEFGVWNFYLGDCVFFFFFFFCRGGGTPAADGNSQARG